MSEYIVLARLGDDDEITYCYDIEMAIRAFSFYLNELPVGFDDMFVGLYRSDSGYLDGYEVKIMEVSGIDLIS